MYPETPVVSPTPSPKKTPKAFLQAFGRLPKRMRLIIFISIGTIIIALGTLVALAMQSNRSQSPPAKNPSPASPSNEKSGSGSKEQSSSSVPQAPTEAPGSNPSSSGGNSGSAGGSSGSGASGNGSGGSGSSGGSGGTGGGGTTPPPTTPPPPSGSRPSLSNTGVPAGTSLTNYSGSSSISDSNVVYDGVNFPALSGDYYRFFGNNLTITNSKIGSGVTFYGDNIRIERSEIVDGLSLSGTLGVVAEYNRIHTFTDDGVHITSDTGQAGNITLAHNYIHNAIPPDSAHSDALQVRGVDNLTLTNNNFDMGAWRQVGAGGPKNAAIFLEGGNGGNRNITLNGNYLNGGGYVVRINTGVNFKFANNRFGRDEGFGLVLNSSSAGTVTQWTGNVRDDNGETVNL